MALRMQQGRCFRQRAKSARMDELQASLVKEGTLDSHGAFQLDRASALKKLKRFQISEPRAYILKLLQWAVARGAQAVRVEVGSERVSLEHDGQSEEVFPPPLLQGHLAIALLAASVLEPRQLIFESIDYRWSNGVRNEAKLRRGSRLALVGMRKPAWRETSPMISSQSSQTFMHVDTDGPLGQMIWDSLGFVRPETALLRQRAFLAGVPVFLNGRLLNRPADLAVRVRGQDLTLSTGRHGHFVFVLAPRWAPGLLMVPAHLSTISASYKGEPALVAGLRMDGSEPLAAFAAIYLGRSGSNGCLHWVQDGVLIAVEPLKGLHRMVYCHCQGLQTDLSQFRLLRDGAYSERMAWLESLMGPT